MTSKLQDDGLEAAPVLLALVGLSPAVLTETIWALATSGDEPVVPERIIVVTTSLGRKRLVDALFDSGGWKAFQQALEARGIAIGGRLRFGNIGDSIRVFPSVERTRELEDIRTEEENAVVAEYLAEIVRGLAEDEGKPIVASLAGGRKTAGALLHSVMTLFGRAEDRLTHVLVDPPFDRTARFLFPGWPAEVSHPDTGEVLETSRACLRLADVPFVPLRYLFQRDLKRSAGSYSRLMTQLRNRALSVEQELEVKLDPERGEARINETPVPLSAPEFAFYLFFARRAAAGDPPIGAYAGLEERLTDLAKRYRPEDDFGHWSQDILERRIDAGEDARKWAASIRQKLRKAGFDRFQIERLVPGKGNLGIQVPPEQISIVESGKSTRKGVSRPYP